MPDWDERGIRPGQGKSPESVVTSSKICFWCLVGIIVVAVVALVF